MSYILQLQAFCFVVWRSLTYANLPSSITVSDKQCRVSSINDS
jgi:hypothetical protein